MIGEAVAYRDALLFAIDLVGEFPIDARTQKIRDGLAMRGLLIGQLVEEEFARPDRCEPLREEASRG